MIQLLYTLSEAMKRKSIYIWDVSKDSITEFTKLALRLIDITGFVTQEKAYIGEWYLNRPVVGVETVLSEEDAVIILSEKCNRNKIPDEVKQKSFIISQMLQINGDLKDKKVYIYGAGDGGRAVYRELKTCGISVEAFCITNKADANVIEDKKIYSIGEIEQSTDAAFIISVLNENIKQEIVEVLDSYDANMYIRDFLNDYTIFVTALFQSVHKAWKEKKKIYIYTRNMGGYYQLIKEILDLYGIEISGCVYKEEIPEFGIRDVYELVYEEIQSIYVLVNDLELTKRKDQIAVYDMLEQIGLSMGLFDYAGFRPVTTTDWNTGTPMIADPLVGWSVIYEKRNLPGIHVIGNMGQEDLRIVVLGGSTSTDGIFRTTSWVRQLYRKLTGEGLAVTIYDCAGPDEDVLQELLRLIRDGVHLRPQYVISMSGVNNEIHRLQGIENKANLKHTVEWYKILAPEAAFVCGTPVAESAFAYWLRMQKIIKAVSELNGSKFLCFLQPIKEAKEKLSIFERSIHFSGDHNNEAASFRNQSRHDDFYRNLLALFDDREGMFIDNCHYSEEANKILAEIVSSELLNDFAG